MHWFLNNSSGTVIVERVDGMTKECGSFPEAEAFLKSAEQENVR